MKVNLISGVPERIIMDVSEENNYVSKIVRNIGVTSAHCYKISKLLQNEKILKLTKTDGRKINIELTSMGKEIRYHLDKISSIIK